MATIKRRVQAVKDDARSKTSKDGWILPKTSVTFADENTWSNVDSDVTPIERRTWSSWTILGFWLSDALSAQSWAGASAVIAVGLTWCVYSTSSRCDSYLYSPRREAVYCLVLGTLTVTLPLVLNGAAGAELHVPFPVVARSSFGFYFSRFAVIIRMVTALFWHGKHSSIISKTRLTTHSHSDLLWFDCNDPGHSCNLAILP